MHAVHRWRRAVNAVNGTTLVGLVMARLGRARLGRGPDGLIVGEGYRLPFPVAGAFTVGNVVLSARPRERLLADERLLAHESRHATQYAVLGPVFWPLYGVAVVWSWLRTGDHWSRNAFERLADLDDGYYVERPVRSLRALVRERAAGRRARRRG